MKKYTLALDLVGDAVLIAEYEHFHKNVWQEVQDSILDAGIQQMEIYRTGNRLFMIVEADDNFSFQQKKLKDDSHPKVMEWENLMWKFQKALPWVKTGKKWIVMDKIFDLHATD